MSDAASSSASRDPGAAFERTTLAWNRTGLSSAAIGALSLHLFRDRGLAGLALSALFLGIGVLAYVSGAQAPVGPRRLRLLSVATSAAAVVSGVLSAAGR